MTPATLSHPVRPRAIRRTKVIDPTIRLHALSTDPTNTVYGPFDSAAEFLAVLHSHAD